ncbi:DDE-type integrase/transposase/recombinase [Chloroflexia bacterium SDU3-3]|nr:DDE-type integrase/transposase/recombinase [Chloroflexia bacterium SDU3-3]
MARLRLTQGSRYLYQSNVYIVRQILTEGRLAVENQSFGGQAIITYAELVEAWGRGEIQFEVRGHNVSNTSERPLATSYTFDDLHMLPAKQRDEAWRRYQLLLPLLRMPPKECTTAAIADYAASLQPTNTVSPTTESVPTGNNRHTRAAIGQATSNRSIQRWLSAFLESGFDIRALVPNTPGHGRKGKTNLKAELEAIVQGILAECVAKPQYRTAQDVYFMIINRLRDENALRSPSEQLVPPSPSTLYRRIQATGIQTVLRRRASRKELQTDAPVAQGPQPTRILERVEIDHTLLDVFIVDEEDRLPIGRPTLTYALDVYTGFPFGFYLGFEPPSYRTISSCLQHGILPKADTSQCYETKNSWLAYGLPELLVIDNGKEFIGQDLEHACAQLGIILERMPVHTPWFKGSIERFFRTNNTGLIHTLPGTTFSNMIDRGDYNVFAHACLPLNTLLKILHIFLLDIYAQRWHDGIGGIPAKRWAESVANGFIPSLHNNAEEVRLLLQPNETRTLQRHGIDFESLVYQSPDIAQMRSVLGSGTTVAIKYDPADLRAIAVYSPNEQRWLRIPAIDQAYTQGLSLWKHRVIRRFVLQQKRDVNIEALAAAKQQIQQIVAHEFSLTRKIKGRKSAARFLDIGANITSDALTVSEATTTADPQAISPKPSLPPPTDSPQQPKAYTAKQSKETSPASVPQGTQETEQKPLPPPSNEDPLDTSGWGGDYHLPSSKR